MHLLTVKILTSSNSLAISESWSNYFKSKFIKSFRLLSSCTCRKTLIKEQTADMNTFYHETNQKDLMLEGKKNY